MATPSFSIDDEKLRELDMTIARKKAEGEIPTTASRSDVIRQLVEGFAEGNMRSRGKPSTADTLLAN